MHRMFMTPYHIEVHTFRNKSEVSPLGRINEEFDFLDFLEGHLNERKTSQQTDTKVFRIGEMRRSHRDLYGIIHGGEHGISSTMEHLDNPNDRFDRTPNHGEYIDFYYQFHIPVNGRRGVLVAQSLGNHSVLTPVRQDIITAFKNAYPALMIRIDPVFFGEELNAILEHGELAELTFTQLTLSEDIAENIEVDLADRDTFVSQFVVAPQRGKRFTQVAQNKVSAMFRKELSPRDIFVSSSFNPIDAEAIYKYGNTRKMIRYSDEEHIRAREEVTNDIQGLPGKPDIDRAKNVADKMIQRYISAGKGNSHV